MSDLNRRRWAVQSEYGREAAGLTYEEAAALVGRLRADKTSGLCIITDEAASHLAPAKKPDLKPADSNSKKLRRGKKKGAA